MLKEQCLLNDVATRQGLTESAASKLKGDEDEKEVVTECDGNV
jgi:hypothetical protein